MERSIKNWIQDRHSLQKDVNVAKKKLKQASKLKKENAKEIQRKPEKKRVEKLSRKVEKEAIKQKEQVKESATVSH